LKAVNVFASMIDSGCDAE